MATQLPSPTVLVTDSRSPAARSRLSPENKNLRRRPMRLASANGTLQHAGERPSERARVQPGYQSAAGQASRPPTMGRLNPQTMPSRSTKVSEKLVLLPETVLEEDEDDDQLAEGELSVEDRRALQEQSRRAKTYAEKLPKDRRTAELPRVTAYCTAQAYRMKAMAEFVRNTHGARTKLYDECLYCAYHLPLLPGRNGARLGSSPVLKSPGGRTVIDERIERSERRDYDEDAFVAEDDFGFSAAAEEGHRRGRAGEEEHERQAPSPPRITSPHRPGLWLSFAEMFVFSYGVVVLWNFSERQEKDILADLAFAVTESNLSLSVRPQREEDFETEEFHFEYSSLRIRPRIFNDMITLRSGDHMIKLAMAHAVAQSTKLSYFEEEMANTMSEAQHVPKRLALTGQLGMSREEVVKILGRLFKSRVDVNLSSNVLDDPRFFWESEPTLQPLYNALKEYLEIRPRVLVLNERCRVFLELAEILTDSISVKKMSRITWIIIILIIISIMVTVSEVFIRFGILSTRQGRTPAGTLQSQSQACICMPRSFR